MNTSELLIFIALGAAFIVLLVKKWGFAEWVQVHGNGFFSKLFSCDLCMSFWACLLFAILTAVFSHDLMPLVMPIFATPLTRMLV